MTKVESKQKLKIRFLVSFFFFKKKLTNSPPLTDSNFHLLFFHSLGFEALTKIMWGDKQQGGRGLRSRG